MKWPLLDPAALGVAASAIIPASAAGDYLIQTHHQAENKDKLTAAGRWACTKHVATYTATQVVAVTAATRACGLRLRPGSVVAGAAISAVTHWVIDRRVHLERAADATGRGEFYRMGKPRPDRDDLETLGTGAHAIDQTLHGLFNLAAAAVMVFGARRR